MIVETSNDLTFEVTFSELDREPGFEDDIRFAMHEPGPPEARILRAATCSILLTPKEAERLAKALLRAAAASRATRQSKRRTNRVTE